MEAGQWSCLNKTSGRRMAINGHFVVSLLYDEGPDSLPVKAFTLCPTWFPMASSLTQTGYGKLSLYCEVWTGPLDMTVIRCRTLVCTHIMRLQTQTNQRWEGKKMPSDKGIIGVYGYKVETHFLTNLVMMCHQCILYSYKSETLKERPIMHIK